MNLKSLFSILLLVGSCITESRPCKSGCDEGWNPVCGTDGLTYRNRCHLQCVSDLPNDSVTVAYAGFCKRPQKTTSEAIETISVTNGGTRGTWGTMEVCPSGSYPVSFRIKVEFDQGPRDDTAMNGIEMLCETDEGVVTATITSSMGPWGDSYRWQSCPSSNYNFVGFALKVEPYGAIDDTAANSIQIVCQTSTGSDTYVLEANNGGTWGSWGAFSPPCSAGSRMCGLSTRVETDQGNTEDDSALNDVMFQCCPINTTILQ